MINLTVWEKQSFTKEGICKNYQVRLDVTFEEFCNSVEA